jgi:hypothetical protein
MKLKVIMLNISENKQFKTLRVNIIKQKNAKRRI